MKEVKRKIITFENKIKIYADIKGDIGYEIIKQRYCISDSTLYRIKKIKGQLWPR